MTNFLLDIFLGNIRTKLYTNIYIYIYIKE